MNKYPSYLLNQPKPLVFITGTIDNEADIHAKIIKVFDVATKDSENKEQPSISFRAVSNDYSFPEKKQQSKDQLSIEGILKYNWPAKHFESVPSVVIFTTGINVDWGPTEWQRKEFLIQEKFTRLKNILSGRDIKLIVIAIKSGNGTIDKDVVDDRINSFKKHLQLNSNIFAFLSPAELLADNSALKKVAKTVKESSVQFYTSRIKSLKSIQKGISEKYRGAFESVLHARYCFKIAFYYEFQGNTAHSLKYYRQCYQALSLSIETIDEELFEQVKTVAEMAHFKICNMLLFSTSVLEAFQQFKSHMTRFSKLYSEFPWKHYAWVSDQYVVFTQLLEMYAVNDSLPDADRAYYYHNAARYNQKRQISFEKTRKDMDLQKSSTTESEKAKPVVPGGRETFKGMILMPPRFIGSPAQILDPVLDQLQPSTEESNKLYVEYLLEQEYKVSHSAVIMRLLTLALERANPNFKRRKGFILSLIAEQCIKEDQFAIALQHLVQSADLLTSEGWVAPAVAVLGLIMKCATLLGRPVEYLNAALTLYANASSLFFSRYELEELHLNVTTLLESTLCSTATTVKPTSLSTDCFKHKKFRVRNAASFLSNSSFVSVLHKSEYGSCATAEKAVEFSLDEAHSTIDMLHIKKMFNVEVTFDNAVVELGQKVLVQLSLTSKFMDDLAFDEMKIYFTDNAIVKRVLHTGDGNSSVGASPNSSERTRRPSQIDASKPFEEGFLLKRMASSEDIMNQHMSSNSDVIHTSLLFPSNKTVMFEFYIYISESGFASFLNPDAILCLERVELMLSNEVEPGVTKQVVMDVSALPESVVKARKNVLKPMILKDILKYTFNDDYPTVTIQKPSALVSMFKPVVPQDGLSLLQGAVHRVNVYLKVGACDMLDGCIFLSSDFNPTCEDDALFWYPDRTQLAELLQAHSNPSDELLDTVRFHSLALNDTYQPAVPLSLGPVCTMDSTLFVPIFVKSNYVQAVTLKLRLEYVPRGRLKSSLSKEFSIKVNFLKALDMSFRVAPSGLAPHDPTPGTVFVGDENLLTASLKCTQSLTHAVGISNLTLDLNPVDIPELQTVLSGDAVGKKQTTCNLLENVVQSISNGSKFPVHLRTGEAFSECRYVRCGNRNKYIDTTQLPPQSLGGVTVHWRQMRRHVLRHTLKNNLLAAAGPVTINNIEWLLPLSHRAAVLAEKKVMPEPLNFNTTISAVGATYFSIPETKLLFPPFIVEVDAPSIATFGQILEVKVAIQSQQITSERLKFATALTDNFLLVGSTYCAFEVPSLGVHHISLTIVPLKCGFLPLPTMLLTWERSPTVTVKVLDTAAGSGLQQQSHSIFIHPAETRQ